MFLTDLKELYQIIKIDKQINSFRSFIVLICYRLQHYFYLKKHRILLSMVGGGKNLLFFLFRLDAQIFFEAQIGHHIRMPHSAMGVVISPKAIVGNNITIFHQVTLGINESKPSEEQPIIIHDNCYLSVGSKIISCELFEGCKVAPNTCVYKDMPANTLCYTLNETKEIKNE